MSNSKASVTVLIDFAQRSDVSALASDIRTAVPVNAQSTAVLVKDDFTPDVPRGKVVGSQPTAGPRRLGVDIEQVLEIRDGALRIHPLAECGWARAAISYGGFLRRNGLGFAVHVLNGHNASEPYRLASLPRRVARWLPRSGTDLLHGQSALEPYQLPSLSGQVTRWLLGSGTDPLLRRLRRFPFRLKRENAWRRLTRWARATRAIAVRRDLGGNLAVGWFSQECPGDPTRSGNCWVVRGAGPENGHLLCRSHGALQLVSSRLANVPVHYFVILREIGAAYYLASLPDVPGAGAFPYMRPVGIDAVQDDQVVHPGLHQSAVGEIGFGVETVVYGAKMADVPGLRQWHGTAHAADSLQGEGLLSRSQADVGGVWVCPQGDFRRTPQGAVACAPQCFAMLCPNAATGLIHAILQPRGEWSDVCLVWRAADEANHWRLRLDRKVCRLELVRDGTVCVMKSDSSGFGPLEQRMFVQITDDGFNISVCLQGEHRSLLALGDATFAHAQGVGLATVDGCSDMLVAAFEAHPRLIEIPPQLRLNSSWSDSGARTVVDERFDSPRHDLAGFKGAAGLVWHKLMGSDRIVLDGDGAKVDASAGVPVSERLAYGVDWADPSFADITARVVPPVSTQAQFQQGRGGLIFWQDAKNYIIINIWLDESHPGFCRSSAVSSFFYLRGFDDVYDAVWTNLADRIRPGEACDLRVVFDGLRYRVHVNGEPVLYRALNDIYPRFGGLAIRRVGIVANWEWGHDTGSRFLSFTALRR